MVDSGSNPKQSIPANITSLLDIEPLDMNLFRFTNLRRPRGDRGVYGGQVISQAILAAAYTVDRAFHIHSLHCYFVFGGVTAPIYYHVDRIRNGRSYSTRAVRAVQNGKTIFVMLCSFQKPEPWQPAYRSPMPEVPDPEECETLQVYWRRYAGKQTDEWAKRRYTARAESRERGPVEVRLAGGGFQEGYYVLCMWMRVNTLAECDAAYQKAVLGYISDLYFLEVGSYVLGLRESQDEGADVVAFTTTIDHSIWYYSDDFDCSNWLLLESRTPQAGSGRAIVHRRAFTRDGTLIANFTQEGVVRARVNEPEEYGKVEGKL